MDKFVSNTSQPRPSSVYFVLIDEGSEGQRIDNFLFRTLKSVPKSRIYKALRKGEVRVNKKRVKPEFKLSLDDNVRIPPLKVSDKAPQEVPGDWLRASLESRIIFEDEALLVINKPSGVAVHGGSGISLGVIESLRAMRPESRFLELVHRLDRDTSGCLMIAKKRAMLLALQQQLKEKKMQKYYTALLAGKWSGREHLIDAPLKKNVENTVERQVRVMVDGKPSQTLFHVERRFANATLVDVKPVTGRTHQIRVHAQFAGHPILGDNRYGDAEENRNMKKLGLKRLFLHARSLEFCLPGTESVFRVDAPLDDDLQRTLERLAKQR